MGQSTTLGNRTLVRWATTKVVVDESLTLR